MKQSIRDLVAQAETIKRAIAQTILSLPDNPRIARLSDSAFVMSSRDLAHNDGFISHYDNDVESWLAKGLAEWDYNELGTLLLAFVELCGVSGEDMGQSLYEYTFSGNGEEDDARSAGMNWPAYERALVELRETRCA